MDSNNETTYQETHYGFGASDGDLHIQTQDSSQMLEVLHEEHRSLQYSALTIQLQTGTGDRGTPVHKTTF
jgi:hypothetical protein